AVARMLPAAVLVTHQREPPWCRQDDRLYIHEGPVERRTPCRVKLDSLFAHKERSGRRATTPTQARLRLPALRLTGRLLSRRCALRMGGARNEGSKHRAGQEG